VPAAATGCVFPAEPAAALQFAHPGPASFSILKKIFESLVSDILRLLQRDLFGTQEEHAPAKFSRG
jgi:hypothetical protein